MNKAELNQLIDDAIEGIINESDFLRLEAELSVDQAARQLYYDRMKLDLLLCRESASSESLHTTSVTSESLPALRNKFIALSIALATAACVAILVWSGLPNKSIAIHDSVISSPSVAAEPTAEGVAVLSGGSNAVWNQSDITIGSLLPTGQLHLQSGLAQIELFSGVQMIVEGEAIFTLSSAMDVKLSRGKTRIVVPEAAQGFRLTTNQGEVVDFGTEFAVESNANESLVRVLDGEIEVRPSGGESLKLVSGDAARRMTADALTTINHDETSIGPARFLDDTLSTKQDAWNDYAATLQSDDRLIVYYRSGMAQSPARSLPNLASNSNVSSGAIVVAEPSRDRWGDSIGSLDFSHPGSRVRLNVSNNLNAMTLIAWVKINSLDRWYNSLFLTDGHDLHEPHWQIMNDGRLFFSIKKRDQWDTSKGEKDKHVFYSPSFWNAAKSGQWQMIATVYDPTQKQVTHFINGQSISTESIPDEYLVYDIHIGNAALCNWSEPERNDAKFAIRNLNGSLDEFMLFDAALASEQIKEIYENGKP
jgi:hypothetical protein